MDQGAEVHSIRCIRTGAMILVNESKGFTYNRLAEEVLSEGMEVRALTVEETLQCENLDEFMDSEELNRALQCNYRLRIGSLETQVTLIQLPVAVLKQRLTCALVDVFVEHSSATRGLIEVFRTGIQAIRLQRI